MIQVKTFYTTEHMELEEHINAFIRNNNIEIVDIKYSTLLDTYNNIIMEFGMIIYKEKGNE